MSVEYRTCTRCIMDTTDPGIEFDENGVCNHCRSYEVVARQRLVSSLPKAEQLLTGLVEEIKNAAKQKEYDCIIGVSGGVDSTYTAYAVKRLGLRPLAVHLDNGWNSELAVGNIEKCLKTLGIDLYTHVLDWEEFRDLQVSFLKASVPDAEIPTDHAIYSVLYRTAVKEGIRYIIIGSNAATEGVLPLKWAYGIRDWRYIENVHKRFGGTRLETYPHYSLIDLLYFSAVKRIESVSILNYVPYNKQEAVHAIESELGWRDYGGKHYESIYTRFFQGYILPRKFNIDKRKAHLSSLICSGQLSREAALQELAHNPYTHEMQMEDREYVIKKLELTEAEFDSIMAARPKTFLDYPTYYPLMGFIRTFQRVARKSGMVPGNRGTGNN